MLGLRELEISQCHECYFWLTA